MSLPANFSGAPGEELHRHFRNLCIETKKIIKSSKNPKELEEAMEHFIDSSKQMNWHQKPSGVYHKDEGDKAVMKVKTEFTRYIDGIKSKRADSNPQDLLDALAEVDRLVGNLKAT